MNLAPYRNVIARYYPGAQLESMVRLTGGVSADVYRLDIRWSTGEGLPVVLRVHGDSHSGHPAVLEFDLLRGLAAAGVPVPGVQHVDVSGELLPHPFLLMAFVEGSTAIPVAQAPSYIDAMAAVLAGIHRTAVDGLPQLPARIDPLPEVFDFLPRGSEWGALRAHLELLSATGYEHAPKLLHGDFWPENLLWQKGAVTTILDWEDAALGDPVSDVAGCSVELRYQFGVEGMQRFIQAYAKLQPINLNRLALWQVYVAAAAQRFMGSWGLEAKLEAHMRVEALACIREASVVLKLAD